jgi:NADH-quinone oxidoreductase subunit I
MTAWLKTITFYDILLGMKATMSHLVHYRPITEQYPHEKRVLPDNYRGMFQLTGS